ncbi:MAG TPA: putative nucleotide-diphospho-sugar transferase [Parvularculaceae bacterium]|nr:putative nucleotide-diphospho-sugar transferase [Parvularculaceae bacterium]
MPGGVVVCAFVDRNYRKLLSHWLELQARCSDAKPVIFCLDEDTAAVCDASCVIHCLRPYSGDWLGFMSHQMKITREILALGFSPVIADVDALWLRDPLPHVISHPQDMVFSPGTIQPLEAHAAWGNVLCTGFFLLRPTPAVFELVDAALPLIGKMGDQPALNRVLAARGMRFSDDNLYSMPFRGYDVAQSRETRLGECGGLSAALLPNRLYQRLPEPDEPEPFIIHPIAPKVEADKIALFTELGLWRKSAQALVPSRPLRPVFPQARPQL